MKIIWKSSAMNRTPLFLQSGRHEAFRKKSMIEWYLSQSVVLDNNANYVFKYSTIRDGQTKTGVVFFDGTVCSVETIYIYMFAHRAHLIDENVRLLTMWYSVFTKTIWYIIYSTAKRSEMSSPRWCVDEYKQSHTVSHTCTFSFEYNLL